MPAMRARYNSAIAFTYRGHGPLLRVSLFL